MWGFTTSLGLYICKPITILWCMTNIYKQLKYLRGNAAETWVKKINSFKLSILRKVAPPLHEKCPYSKLFWSECSKLRTRITTNTDNYYAVLIFVYFCYSNRKRIKTISNLSIDLSLVLRLELLFCLND